MHVQYWVMRNLVVLSFMVSISLVLVALLSLGSYDTVTGVSSADGVVHETVQLPTSHRLNAAVLAVGEPSPLPMLLTVNGHTNHLAVDLKSPLRFRWTVPHLKHASCRKTGQMQSRFELVLHDQPFGTLPHNQPALWQSGLIASTNSFLVIASEQLALKTAMKYHWKVRTVNGVDECASEFSEEAHFHTALVDWVAVPIWTAPASAQYAFARTEVQITKKVVTAIAYATGQSRDRLLAGYKLYLNADLVAVGPGRADPGFPFSKTPVFPFDTVDVTNAVVRALQQHNNRLAVCLQGFGGKMILELHITMEDDSTMLVATSTGPGVWSTLDADSYFNPSGSTASSYVQPKENIDARVVSRDWLLPNFVASGWVAPQQTKPFNATLQAKRTRSVGVTLNDAVVLNQTSPTSWFFDFGRETQATIRMTITNGIAGQKLRILLGEELSGPGTVLFPMRTGNHFDSIWTLKDGLNVIEGHEYMEFRYGQIIIVDSLGCAGGRDGEWVNLTCGPDAFINYIDFASFGGRMGDCERGYRQARCGYNRTLEVVKEKCLGKPSCTLQASSKFIGTTECLLTLGHAYLSTTYSCAKVAEKASTLDIKIAGWVVQYPYENGDSQFASSNVLLNRVWELCRYTLQFSALDTFTDSNTRERLPYEADGMITGGGRFMLQRDTTWPRHSFSVVFSNPTWPTEWRQMDAIIAYMDYMYSGDMDLADFFFDVLLENSMASYVNGSLGLIDWNHQSPPTKDIVDWPNASRDNYVFSPVNTVVNAYGYKSILLLSLLANVTGRSDQSVKLKNLAETIKQSMLKNLLSSKNGLFCDGLCSSVDTSHQTWHASVFPLWLGVVDDRPEVRSSLFNMTSKRGMIGSVYAAFGYLLSLYNYDDDHGHAALNAMTTCIENSWCRMLNDGATATEEAWTAREKPNESWSHPWATAPVYAIATGLMGIKPVQPGFSRFIVQPQLGNLTSAAITVPSMAGFIRVSVLQNDHSFTVRVGVPANTEATICTPKLGSTTGTLTLDGFPVPARTQRDYLCVDNVGSSVGERIVQNKVG